ncbi:hypothetical protein GCM10027612_05420 [Microbispora bryophytorum subsp. camponoti]
MPRSRCDVETLVELLLGQVAGAERVAEHFDDTVALGGAGQGAAAGAVADLERSAVPESMVTGASRVGRAYGRECG